MSTVTISHAGVRIHNDPWETVYNEKIGNLNIQIVGEIRTTRSVIFDALHELNRLTFRTSAINKFFEDIPGDYVVLIKNKENICILPCYSYPIFYIVQDNFKNVDHLVLTNIERMTLKNGINPKRLLLRIASKQGFFIPKGMGSAVDDVLIPGMGMQIDKDTFAYEQFWILPLEAIAERTDHNAAARDIAETFVEEMVSYKKLQGRNPITLQLSSGLDSALLLASARAAGLDVIPVNFHSPISPQECTGAKQSAKYFNLDLVELLRGPSFKEIPFSEDSDITDYLERMVILLETGSPMFVLDDISLLVPYHFGYHHSIEGSSYPTQLCIQHNTVYPKISRKLDDLRHIFRFDPKKGQENRYRFSVDFAKKRLANDFTLFDDRWCFSSNWPQIHPYYWDYLEPCFTGAFLNNGLVSKYFPLFSSNEEIPFLFYESVIDRGNEILKKMFRSDYLKNLVLKPDPLAAVKLLKVVVYINMAVFSNSKLYNYRKAGIMNQHRPGISSKMQTLLHSICIDDIIVNYPKWHLFRAFELLSKKSFFDIHKFVPFKNYALQKRQIYKFGKENVKTNFKLLYQNNKSLNAFIKKKNVYKIYYDLKKAFVQNKEVIHALNTLERLCQKNQVSAYWHMNQVMNIAFLYNSSFH